MIGIDTNVLVRYLTQDDAAQAAKASRIIDAAGPATLFIGAMVICETVWVLEDCYNQKRENIAQVLEKLLLTVQFSFESKDLLWLAVSEYRSGRGDLSDHLIGEIARRAGCEHTLTFDRDLRTSRLFRLL